MADLKENESLVLVIELIQRGSDPVGILEDARSAMECVEDRFEKCEYFIPDSMMASEILKGISEIVRPFLRKADTRGKRRKVIIGTVAGDTHSQA
jgi:methanogenic corrinoid protein MtbC1